jgi:hypothetical protein
MPSDITCIDHVLLINNLGYTSPQTQLAKVRKRRDGMSYG